MPERPVLHMTDKTTAIMERIREVCPELMELSEGCEVNIPFTGVKTQQHKYGHGIITKSYVGKDSSWSGYDAKKDAVSVYMTDSDVYRPCISLSKNKIQIIGHPVHLEHLMRTFDDVHPKPILELHGASQLDIATVESHGRDNCIYDLTLTVEENLEQNEVLRDFIYSLICKV